jgi:hypothetical protein
MKKIITGILLGICIFGSSISVPVNAETLLQVTENHCNNGMKIAQISDYFAMAEATNNPNQYNLELAKAYEEHRCSINTSNNEVRDITLLLYASAMDAAGSDPKISRSESSRRHRQAVMTYYSLIKHSTFPQIRSVAKHNLQILH